MGGQVSTQTVVVHGVISEDHIADDGLALHVVACADDGGFHHEWVVDERRFDLGCRDAVTSDVHDVVDTSEKRVVAISIKLGSIASEVTAREPVPIRGPIALGFAPHATQHRGPGLRDREIATAFGHTPASIINELRKDPGNPMTCRSGLRCCYSRKWGDHVGTGLGLPPRVHDGYPSLADVLVQEHPGLGVDRLADRPKNSE